MVISRFFLANTPIAIWADPNEAFVLYTLAKNVFALHYRDRSHLRVARALTDLHAMPETKPSLRISCLVYSEGRPQMEGKKIQPPS